MPGLFGIYAKNTSLPPEQLAQHALRMADVMRRYPWQKAEVASLPGFVGGRVFSDCSPHWQSDVQPDDESFCTLDGFIHAVGDRAPEHAGCDALRAWMRCPESAATLDGQFAYAQYDPSERRLKLVADRLGLRRVYCVETPDLFAFAGEVWPLLAILPHRPALDEVSLVQFFSFGHLFGLRSWWEGIRLLPPAAFWEVGPDRRTERRYWTFDAIRRDPQDEEAVLDEVQARWRTSVRQAVGTTRMPFLLSGGFDSRYLLAELLRNDVDITSVTFAGPGSSDAPIARKLARRMGIEHVELPLDDRNWWHRREEFVANTDGEVDALHSHVAVSFETLRQLGGYSMLSLAGDVLFGGSWLKAQAIGDWPRNGEQVVLAKYQSNPFFTREEAAEAVRSDVAGWCEGPSTDCLMLLHRGRRFTPVGQRAAQPFCEFAYPSVSNRMLEMLLGSVPDEARLDGAFYRKLLMRHFPEWFKTIRSTTCGHPLTERALVTALRSQWSRIASTWGKRWRRRVVRPLFGSRFGDYSYSVGDYGRLLGGVAPLAREWMRRGMLADEVLGGCASEALSDSLRNGHIRGVTKVLTFEAYLRQVDAMPQLLPHTSGGSTWHDQIQVANP